MDLSWEHETPPAPAVIDFTTHGTMTMQPEATCPETHFKCPGEGYCLPVYARCNGLYECPGWEDEEECDKYTCPGFYRCLQSRICVHAEHMCDKVFQCPERDDELMCGMTCPHGCRCNGHAFVCTREFSLKDYPQLRYLDADETGLKLKDASANRLLVHLSLRGCGIRDLEKVKLQNLKSLNLSNNSISVFDDLEMPNLNILDLSFNSLKSFTMVKLQNLKKLCKFSIAFNQHLSLLFTSNTTGRFRSLRFIDFSGIYIREISEPFLQAVPKIQHLNLSGSKVQQISQKGFSALRKLRVLDLEGCPMTFFSRDVFKGLQYLETIFAENYRLCCPQLLPEGFCTDKCYAPDDDISSCDALLRADIFRLFLVIYASLALVGNLVSYVYRMFGKHGEKKQLGFDVFVTHLCVSDFLMGVYLAIIGVADRWYYGTYAWSDREWTHSGACQLAGFLSLLSSEVSAFLICLITLERFLLVRFPHKGFHFTSRSGTVASLVSWAVGLVLAAVPLLPFTDHWQFYSQTGICIPLPITKTLFPGKDYSFVVMIVVNFFLFILIALGQLLIFWSYHSQSKTAGSSGKRSKDMAIARRLLIVAMSDFLCWFPIGLLGLMARYGFPVSGEVNVAMAIFILPFNSAANPFLYTFHMVREKRQKIRKAKKMRSSEQASTAGPSCSQGTRFPNVAEASSSSVQPQLDKFQTDDYTAEEAGRLIMKFLQEELVTSQVAQKLLVKLLQDGLVTPEFVRRLSSSSAANTVKDNYTTEEAGQLMMELLKDDLLTSQVAQELLARCLHEGLLTHDLVQCILSDSTAQFDRENHRAEEAHKMLAKHLQEGLLTPEGVQSLCNNCTVQLQVNVNTAVEARQHEVKYVQDDSVRTHDAKSSSSNSTWHLQREDHAADTRKHAVEHLEKGQTPLQDKKTDKVSSLTTKAEVYNIRL